MTPGRAPQPDRRPGPACPHQPPLRERVPLQLNAAVIGSVEARVLHPLAGAKALGAGIALVERDDHRDGNPGWQRLGDAGPALNALAHTLHETGRASPGLQA